MTQSEQRTFIEAVTRELRSLRVDTYDRRCQWFRVQSGTAAPVSLKEIWGVCVRTAKQAGMRVSGVEMADMLRAVQKRVPLLTEGEYYGRRWPRAA